MSCTAAVPATPETSGKTGADTGDKPVAAKETIPSPSDVPPGAATGGGALKTTRQPQPNNDQSRTLPQRGAESTPAAANSGATLTFGQPQQPSPASLDRATAPPAVIHEPPVAGPLSTTPAPRDPAIIDPAGTGAVEAPAAGTAATAASEPAVAPTPRTTDIRPRNDRNSAPTAASAPPMGVHRSPAEPALPTIKPATDSPLVATPAPSAPSSRTPAADLSKPIKTAVDAPGFPPAVDDPFAPLPKKPEPANDDPFAPLPPAKQASPEPAAPIAAEPTNLKAADALLLGADGKLPVREWRDNSGQFRIKAKLILILDGKVRLLKDTGRTTTVELAQLSEADRSYVNEVIGRYGTDLTTLDQLAAR